MAGDLQQVLEQPIEAPSGTVLVLTGEATPVGEILRGLWARRDLLPMLAKKDFQSRYRSASLGVAWSVLLPVIQGAVLAVVFSVVVRVPAHGDNQAVYIMSGMVTWTYFTTAWSMGSTSIVDGGQIAGKVYFPRLIMPTVPALANFPSFAISVGVVLAIMGVFRATLYASILWLPVAMVMTVLFAIELSAICSVLHVYYRDIRYIVQALTVVALYATPVIYPLELAKRWQWVLILGNPMTGPIQLTHLAVLGHATKVGEAVAVSCGYLTVLGVITLLVYRRHERTAIDRL